MDIEITKQEESIGYQFSIEYKHGTHDQQSHGNERGGGKIKVGDIVSLPVNTVGINLSTGNERKLSAGSVLEIERLGLDSIDARILSGPKSSAKYEVMIAPWELDGKQTDRPKGR